MKRQGYTSDEINAKLPEEPIQKSGFQFGAVMGKRLIDYGILSSSSDSQQEDEVGEAAKNDPVQIIKPASRKSLSATQQRKMDEQRRESKPVPMQDDADYEERQDGSNLEGDGDLTARQMRSADHTADLTGRSDIRMESEEDWVQRSAPNQRSMRSSKMNQVKDNDHQNDEQAEEEEEYDGEYGDYYEEGEEEQQDHQDNQIRPGSMDFDDD